MPNYKIEGNVDFYEELYKSLDEPEDVNEVNVCLITNKPLEEDCVTLVCNHKFNYDAIYNDILNHKKKYNSMERNSLKSIQIRCPYCRTVQNSLLPQKNGYKTVHGVNHYDETQDTNSLIGYCPSQFIQGKCNYKYPDAPENHGGCCNKYVKMLGLDQKHYCSAHYNITFSKLYKEKKQKEKQEKDKKKALALLEKIKAQEDKQKAKEEKQKAKEDKQKAKEEKQKAKEQEKVWKAAEKIQKKTQKTQNENVIISLASSASSSSQNSGGCVQLLKTGKNKGTQCGCKISLDGLCGRHYKLLHPVSPDEQT
jgi:hypothetical protein